MKVKRNQTDKVKDKEESKWDSYLNLQIIAQ
jgi:hypothetical protein